MLYRDWAYQHVTTILTISTQCSGSSVDVADHPRITSMPNHSSKPTNKGENIQTARKRLTCHYQPAPSHNYTTRDTTTRRSTTIHSPTTGQTGASRHRRPPHGTLKATRAVSDLGQETPPTGRSASTGSTSRPSESLQGNGKSYHITQQPRHTRLPHPTLRTPHIHTKRATSKLTTRPTGKGDPIELPHSHTPTTYNVPITITPHRNYTVH